MDALFSDAGLILLAALAGGFVAGWLIRSTAATRRIGRLHSEWRSEMDSVVQQRERLVTDATSLRTTVEAQEAVVHQRDMVAARLRTDRESALENERQMKKNIFTLRAEREDFKSKMATFQNRMAFLQQQSTELQSEFMKSRDFYKGELLKAFEKRKLLEEKLDHSQKEYESFSTLLQASRSEQDSVNKMLEAAKTRLTNLDQLEQSVIALEAENAQLKHDSALSHQEIDALRRDVSERDELKVQNNELAQVLKSMENSRKQYEDDANRYRERADKTEKQSETLRIRLDEVEKNFQEIETQQRNAIKEARRSALSTAANDPMPQEVDDLQEIVGVGKVFEHALHELGIVSFRQIANFDMTDIARVNTELREFKGRMEQDDWIGQAKELLYKKYGAA